MKQANNKKNFFANRSRWFKIKTVLFFVMLLHAIFFLLFLFKNLSNPVFTVQNLATKMAVLFAILAALTVLYIMVLRKIAWVKKTAIFLREFIFIGYLTSMLYLLLIRFVNPPVTLTQIADIVRGNGAKSNSVGLRSMNTSVKLAVIASEDQLFADHDGFDLKAIKKAMKYNETHKQKQRGASTISQQTAKNVFLWQGGGYLRKALEVFFTFTIEKLWSKKIILERYLNVAETGKGIYGVEAAAQQYFKKSAASLSADEAAKIIACLPSPKTYTVVPASGIVKLRASRILRQMRNLQGDGRITELVQ